MLFREKISVRSENRMKHHYAVQQKAELLNVKAGGIHSNHHWHEKVDYM